MAIIMGRPAGQDPVLKGPTLVVAAQILAIKVRVTMVVIINSLVMVTISKGISQDIRVIQNSSMVASTMFSPQVFANEIRRLISGRFM
jgi:hypothetical protein